MNLEKAVEAAARVFYESQTGADNLDTSTYRATWIRIAEQAMEAAAPLIAAQALTDAAAALEEWVGVGNTIAVEDVADDLRANADRMTK